MNIMYAADDNYAEIMAVSISSLVKHNNNLHIVILSDDISHENINTIQDVVGRNNTCSVQFVDTEQIMENIRKLKLRIDRGSLAQYIRLFFSNVLPKNWDRCLYLDCDTLVVDSLDELYRTDLTGYVLGGIKDCFSRWHYKALGMDDGDVYINSGILLIDIDEWRKEGIEQRMLGKINQCNGKSLQGDQGLINTVLKGRVKNLPLRYNILTYYYDFTYDEIKLYRKPLNCYSKTEIDNAKSNPAIVHFTSSFASIRPWKTNESNHPYYNEWKKEYEKLGGKIKQQGKGVILTVYQRMPHFIALAIIGLVHAYVKPIRYMMKEKITL